MQGPVLRRAPTTGLMHCYLHPEILLIFSLKSCSLNEVQWSKEHMHGQRCVRQQCTQVAVVQQRPVHVQRRAAHTQLAWSTPWGHPGHHSPRQTAQIGSCNHKGSSKSVRSIRRKEGSRYGRLLELLREATCPVPRSCPYSIYTIWSEH